MKKLLGLAAVATVLMIAAQPALGQDKTLAIVVKGLDNPFFEQINLGCQKWNAENKGKGYTCLYTGPASSADEAGEVQIVDDLLTKGVAAIAISPSNAPLMANLLKKRAPKIPVMTIDADLAKEDAGLRKTYLGTDNYLMGVKFAEYLKKFKPKGGTICLQLGNVAADNINARAAGTRDTLAGAKGTASADRPERLEGDRRLPGVHQRSGRPRQPADGRRLHRQSQARRLRAGRRLGPVRAPGLRAGHRPGDGQVEEQGAGHRGG